MKKNAKKIIAIALTLAMILSINGLSNVTFASAAKKAPKLSTKKVTVKVKASKKVKLKNKPKGAKVTWTSKNKKIATVKNGKITGKKAGSTKVVCKVTYKKKVGKKKKKVTKKLTVKVTVQKASKKTTKPTAKPTAKPTQKPTPIPTATPVPETSNLTTEHDSQNGIKTKDNGQMRTNLKSSDMMRFMGLGWNYGNSLEASVSKDAITDETTVTDHETAWNNEPLDQADVDALKKYGFKNIRIPVAWSNMISDDGKYTINDAYFNRVEEVMNYALNAEMYVIIDIHWDGDWWGMFGDPDESIREQAWTRFRSYWTQISERYKEYSDRVIFESANEELGDRLNDDWRNMSTYPKTGTLTVDEQYDTLNQINQEFVDIVRKSGGNNTSRYLLIAGYSTNIDATCDSRFKMPTDLAENGKNRLSVSVHYYSPWNYCGGGEYKQEEGMAPRLFTWGTDADIQAMHADFDKMTKFTKQGYGVIIGEFGVQAAAVDGIPTYFKELSNYTMKLGMSPVLWDNGGWLSRSKSQIVYDDISDAILQITGSTATFPEMGQNTGKPKYETAEESELTLKYVWEGEWTKNNNKSESENPHKFKTTSISDGEGNTETAFTGDVANYKDEFLIHCNNNYHYWSVIATDWSKFKQPYIRVTAKDVDSGAIQIGYADFRESAPDNYEKTEQHEKFSISCEEGWDKKCISIDKDMLSSHDAMWLTFSTGSTITKIEIFDGPELDG